MGDFSKSAWANEAFSSKYIDRADIYIAQRSRLLERTATFYRHISGGRRGLKICDLGCGDGIIAETLLSIDGTIAATLIDASEAMLKRARLRLSEFDEVDYIEASLDDIAEGKMELPVSDCFVSSMAIHHLDANGKAALFGHMHSRLNSGGFFINVDTVKPRSEALEALYFSIWSEWMQHMMDGAGVNDETPSDVIERYTDPSSPNRPDTLESQMNALNEAGFENVDCFYKNGIFAIYFGQKRYGSA